MLKRRLIPKLQLSLKNSFRGPRPILVVTKEFSNKRAIGDPLSQAKIYEAQLADELILVDLERTEESWEILLETVESISEVLATPLTVGGGLRKFEQVQELLDRGADKAVLNSAALNDPSLIDSVANTYGSQCVVISIDTKEISQVGINIFSEAGKFNTHREIFSWAKEVVDRGAGEILYTSIDRDGSGKGLDKLLIEQLASKVNVPIIASGGCGVAQHFVDGYLAGASGVAAGTYFSQRDQNPMQCRSHIYNAGIPIRLEV